MCSPQIWDPNFTPQVPGSAPWAAEGGVRRQGPSFLSPRRLWRRVSQEVPGPLPWCPGPVPPVPSPEAGACDLSLRLVPQTEGRVQGGASGAGRSCLRMQIPGPLTDSGLPLHRPHPPHPCSGCFSRRTPLPGHRPPAWDRKGATGSSPGAKAPSKLLPQSQGPARMLPYPRGRPCAVASLRALPLPRPGVGMSDQVSTCWALWGGA